MVDAQGSVATHTGARCIAHAGHRTGDNVSVQANMMERDTVPDAMLAAYESASGDLAERMLAALDAAEAEGGDIRGKQSAAMLVVRGERRRQAVVVDARAGAAGGGPSGAASGAAAAGDAAPGVPGDGPR